MKDLNKERELETQIEVFKKEAMELWFVPNLADTYKNKDLFSYSIMDGEVFFMREQARQLWSFWKKAKAQAVPDTHVVVPKGVLDLTRFMCKTWAEIDTFVYKNCTNLGEYPVIHGTSNQFNLEKIGNQKVDNKNIHSAVNWFLESESGADG